MKTTNNDRVAHGHYVYLYRDTKGKVRYVGYGVATGRPTSHLQGSHNDKLNAFLAAESYHLEISGPFGSEEVGRAVETALISALQPDLNSDPGPWQWRFRPLGVPVEYAERLTMEPLTGSILLKSQGASPLPVLCVPLTNEVLSDGRVGYDPAQPPSDAEILSRVEKWWQLGAVMKHWHNHPDRAPGTLLGIHGRPKAQVVVASLRIDPLAWRDPERSGAHYSIKTAGPSGLDAFSLRGRRVGASANIRFGSFPTQFIVIIERDGVAYGGHPTNPRIVIKAAAPNPSLQRTRFARR